MGFLDSLLGLNTGDATIKAAKQNKALIGDYNTNANQLIDTGASQANGYLTNADNLAQLGLNSVGTSFQESPGYQFGLDQGLQALQRTAAARGGLGGGGLGTDELKYATGYADDNYNNWLGQEGAAIDRRIGAQGNLASLATGTAGAKVGVAGDVLNGMMGANNQRAAGQTTNAEGLSNLFGEAVGSLTSMATGGLSNLAKFGNVFGNAAQGAAGNAFKLGYGGF